LKGIKNGRSLSLTRLPFVDDVLPFCDGSLRDATKLKEILELYCIAISMTINMKTSSICFNGMEENHIKRVLQFFPYNVYGIQDGLKFLGFFIKPNDYGINDWRWLIAKAEKRINLWCIKWLSRDGWLVLVKSVLEAILVYWKSLYYIPKIILEKIMKISFRFLLSGNREKEGIPLVKWKKIAKPKEMGDWGLKNISPFGKSLAAMCVCRDLYQKRTYGIRSLFKNILNPAL
jgi:hypothetical protein